MSWLNYIFSRLFGAKCCSCSGIIAPTESARFANGNVYHSGCFTCVVCCHAVKTGDYFYIRHDHKIICGTDYNLQFGSSKFLVYLGKFLLSSAGFFFKIIFFKKISQEHYQSVQNRTKALSVLIWVQTVCKGYQQTINVVASKERVIIYSYHIHVCHLIFLKYPRTMNLFGLTETELFHFHRYLKTRGP